ncbi:HAD superfamily hydrolase [Natronomonas pharaonis DSM 2160]|uniref:HAD superfamily hydrolase n=1 Tax=Natronomonas pharaonis (strain ATCC 35678 / DSM 2160 / CIP 103997 / JCM 8858 / NBRC 14720 / NCIMB 2260 / Gabara) TaxID=348780 RepID=A0A1U7EVC9_NATPD|nr:HAD family hydrolase [Natronomonas pharaonis]CAI48972.1 HAD superfamily hydrolase [Natronomonas pharaonis DSM 2160]
MTDSTYDRWVFDLDGTLVDVEPEYVRSVFDRVGDRLGYAFSERQADGIWHGLGGARNEALRSWGVAPEQFWTAFHEVEDPAARADATFLYADAAVVGDIDAPTALVTHCQSYLTEAVLSELDIEDWFDTVVCCTESTGWKPDPKPVELALSALDADGNGVLVGDGPHDIGAAWNAGLDGAHVERHSPEQRGLCVVGDHRLSRVDELA